MGWPCRRSFLHFPAHCHPRQDLGTFLMTRMGKVKRARSRMQLPQQRIQCLFMQGGITMVHHPASSSPWTAAPTGPGTATACGTLVSTASGSTRRTRKEVSLSTTMQCSAIQHTQAFLSQCFLPMHPCARPAVRTRTPYSFACAAVWLRMRVLVTFSTLYQVLSVFLSSVFPWCQHQYSIHSLCVV